MAFRRAYTALNSASPGFGGASGAGAAESFMLPPPSADSSCDGVALLALVAAQFNVN